MKRYFKYVMTMTVLMFAASLASAQMGIFQSVMRSQARQHHDSTSSKASSKLKKAEIKVKDKNLDEAVQRAERAKAQWNQDYKNKVWFADQKIRQACLKVPGCDSFFQDLFKKDNKLSVIHYQVSYGGFRTLDNGQLGVEFISIEFLYSSKVYGGKRWRIFRFKNVPLSAPNCIECKERASKHYMQETAGSFR